MTGKTMMLHVKTIRCPGLLMLTLMAINAGCGPAPASGKGFTLPTGDAEIGKAVFVKHNCHHCHSVAGTDLPLVDDREMNVRLGGEVSRISTYGELVTSIINPSHRLAKGHSTVEVSRDGVSLMNNYNAVLTVQQLIDLTAFLQSRYVLRQYERTDYPLYCGPLSNISADLIRFGSQVSVRIARRTFGGVIDQRNQLWN